jgi:Carbohydrate binding module (family 6).
MNLSTQIRRKKTALTALLLLLLPALSVAQRTFVHPGISHKLSDLERMKCMVQAGVEPWKTTYARLQENKYASYSYQVKGDNTMTVLNTSTGDYNKFKFDGLAAYYNALMWSVTGDKRHAEKAVQIFKAWSNIRQVKTGGTACLDAGRVIWKIMEAAEIIKSTYPGWKREDIDKFKAMIVYPGYSSTQVPAQAKTGDVSFYWHMYNGDAGRHGNQGLFGYRGVMAMGIFLDNEVMYDRALRALKGLPHRADDLPYPAGPPVTTTTPQPSSNAYFDEFRITAPFAPDKKIEDYGYNEAIKNYIWENGQGEETSRDQAHAVLGVSIILTLCEMAWNQGDDIYSFLNNRPLKGIEFALRYNASYKYAFPDQPQPWEPTVENGEFIRRKDRSGRWLSKAPNPYNGTDLNRVMRGEYFRGGHSPIEELVLGHYQGRMGLKDDSVKWTRRTYEISMKEDGVEQGGFDVDHPGWGGLTFHRPTDCAGDPCRFENGHPVFALPSLPGKIEAEDFDFFPTKANGKSYYDLTPKNTGGAYRSGESVDIEKCPAGGFQVANVQPGEWLNYTVNVPINSAYDVKINYAAANGNGKIKVAFDGTDKTAWVDVPFGGENSTKTGDFKTMTIAKQIALSAGVQSMRIYFDGAANAFTLNNIQVELNPAGSKKVNLNAKDTKTSIQLDWATENILAKSRKIYRGTTPDLKAATVLAENVSGSGYNDRSAVADAAYYYWVSITAIDGQELLSPPVKGISHIGLVNDNFRDGTTRWAVATNGASSEMVDNALKVTFTTMDNGTLRGDIKRNAETVLHAGNYPILAIKGTLPEKANIQLASTLGTLGNGSNKFRKMGNSVIYYDLSAIPFVSKEVNSFISKTEATVIPAGLSLKVADVTSSEDAYNISWVKTFKDVDELKTYLKSEGKK